MIASSHRRSNFLDLVVLNNEAPFRRPLIRVYLYNLNASAQSLIQYVLASLLVLAVSARP